MTDDQATARYVLHARYASIDDLYRIHGGRGFKLDLGCGYVKPPGSIGIDNLVGVAVQVQNTDNAPDILMDLNASPLPFPDGSCEEVRSSHFLEHSDINHILAESHRVLRRGGTFVFAVPYANSAEGMYPGHQLFLTEKWFHENAEFQRWFTIDTEHYFPSADWLALPRVVRMVIPFRWARTFLFNACWQMILSCSSK